MRVVPVILHNSKCLSIGIEGRTFMGSNHKFRGATSWGKRLIL